MARPMVNLRKNASMSALIDAAEREAELARETYLRAWEASKSHYAAGDYVWADECKRRSEAMFPLVDGMDLIVKHLKRLASKAD